MMAGNLCKNYRVERMVQESWTPAALSEDRDLVLGTYILRYLMVLSTHNSTYSTQDSDNECSMYVQIE